MFTETLLPDTLRAIKLISPTPEIRQTYLAGGTALALQTGHRISVDLDFFTQLQFNETQLSSGLTALPEFASGGTARWTVWGSIGETNISIFYYKYPLLEKTTLFEGIQLAGLADIAAMKLQAIEGRGTRRDFIDIFSLTKKYTLEEMLMFYRKKCEAPDERLYTILRSLDYFEDAEQEIAMPNMLTPVNWEEVKEFFRQETQRLMQNRLKA